MLPLSDKFGPRRLRLETLTKSRSELTRSWITLAFSLNMAGHPRIAITRFSETNANFHRQRVYWRRVGDWALQETTSTVKAAHAELTCALLDFQIDLLTNSLPQNVNQAVWQRLTQLQAVHKELPWTVAADFLENLQEQGGLLSPSGSAEWRFPKIPGRITGLVVCRFIKDRGVDPRPGRTTVPAAVILPPGKVGFQGQELATRRCL